MLKNKIKNKFARTFLSIYLLFRCKYIDINDIRFLQCKNKNKKTEFKFEMQFYNIIIPLKYKPSGETIGTSMK